MRENRKNQQRNPSLKKRFDLKIKKNLLKRKIRNLKAEEKILMALMKRTQIERFKQNKISGLVYNIRMKKFEEKLNRIKEDLPVLEKRLEGKKIVGKD